MNSADFWNNQKAARRTIEDFKTLRAQTEPLGAVMTDFEDASVGYDLAKEAGDKELLAETDQKLFELVGRMEQVELQSLLNGKHDHRNCFVAIQAGGLLVVVAITSWIAVGKYLKR